jgi:dimethylglycine catabolism A
VIATGARYRFGLGGIATKMLDWGVGRWPLLSTCLSAAKFRDWFYYSARRGTADRFRKLAKPGQAVVAIGDAVTAGKSKEAIASAFEGALVV